MHSRREFLRAVGAGFAALAMPRHMSGSAESTSPTRSKKMNYVIVLVDDMGWTDCRCFGSKYYDTANIDRLASEGMRFTNGYAACAVCSPTRASLLTGRYPARIGITDWIRARFQGGRADPEEKLPEYVPNYDGAERKLLCPRNPWWMEHDEVTIAEALRPAGYTSCHIGKWHLGPDEWYPETQGFHINIGGCDFGHPPSYFDPYHNDDQGSIPTLKARRKGEYLTDREADEAVRFIKYHADRPFFLYLAHYGVHLPLQGKQELIDRYEAKTPTNHHNATYAAMIHSIDDALGRVMAALDEHGLSDSTAIIFTSDNGGLLPVTDNAPLRLGKGYEYEGGIRVPLIIRWPGVTRPGSVCDEPVTSADFFPTILASASVGQPADRAIDGQDLRPLLAQSGPLKREALFWHFPHYRGDVMPYSICREGEWKLIRRYEGRRFELYNLAEDVGETRDLSDELAARTRDVNERLTEWLRATGAKLPKERSQ
jgi:arylsulfatase A